MRNKLTIEISKPEKGWEEYDISAIFKDGDTCLCGGVFSEKDFLKELRFYMKSISKIELKQKLEGKK